MFKLFRYLKDFKKQVIIGPAFKLTEAIFELIVPLVMASLIDVGVKNGDSSYVIWMGLLMVGLGAAGLGCALICQYNAAKASQGFGTVLRNKLFAHINTLSQAELDKVGTSGLITRMTNDINQLQLAVAMLIRLVIRAPFLVLGAAVISLFIDLQLSIIFFISIPVIALVLYLIMSRSVPLYQTVQRLLDKIGLKTRENLSGARVIRAFSAEKREEAQFNNTTDELKTAALRVSKLSALLNPITYVIMNIGIAAIIWFGGGQVFSGALQQGEIIALVQYMTQILLALIVVANLVIIFTKASASAKRINEVFALTASISDNGNKTVNYSQEADIITFNKVSLAYFSDSQSQNAKRFTNEPKVIDNTHDVSRKKDEGENALTDISFTLKRGQTLGIIGGTGSGKSTLVKLISRAYDPTSGEVLFNGVNIKNYPFEQLHRLIGVVPQKAMLFSGTIKSNLQLADENASDEALWTALRIAQAAEFVEKLEDGLSSPVSQGGKNFSGGQRQRLTIARALTGVPSLLILDDSASALDYATDAALRQAITDSLKDTSTVIVSQRAAAIRHADLILVLDDGELAGAGTHSQLIESCPVYAEICNSQITSAKEDDAV